MPPHDGPWDWELLAEAAGCQTEAFWRMLRAAGLTELERILETLQTNRRAGRRVPVVSHRRHVYGYPSLLSLSTVDENLHRTLQSLATRFLLTTEAKQELVRNLIRKYADLETSSLAPDRVNSLAVVRRSVLLLSLYNALWQTSDPAAQRPTDQEPLPWNRIVDLLTWATEADVTLDPDQVHNDCQSLIIDVEKRVYAATICRRASEAFHDEHSHQRIIGHILILFMFGYWDHALTLVDRCFTYADEAYRDFLNLLSYHFPKMKYAWDDIGNPTHPMRDEHGFQNFRLDVRKLFIDETRLRMNENHILRPIVTLLGCVPQLLRTDLDEESPLSDNGSSGDTPPSERQIGSGFGLTEDVDELISNVFEIYRELNGGGFRNNREDGGDTSPPRSLENSFTISWFCCTLFWNRYSCISLLREHSKCLKMAEDPDDSNDDDQSPAAFNPVDTNIIGYIYQLWASEKKIDERLLPLSDVAYSLLIGNDLDQLLLFVESHQTAYLPTTAALLATFAFFDFQISVPQLVRVLMRTIPALTRVLRGGQLISAYDEQNVPTNPAWSIALQEKLDSALGPFAIFYLLLMRLETDSSWWDSLEWWEGQGRTLLVQCTPGQGNGGPDPLIYCGLRFILSTMLFPYSELVSQIRVHWLKCLMNDCRLETRIYALLEYQKLLGEIGNQWVTDNENKLEAEVTPLPCAFHVARNQIQVNTRSLNPLNETGASVRSLAANEDLIELALSVTEHPRVASPEMLEAAILALLIRAETYDCAAPVKVEMMKKAFINIVLSSRNGIRIDTTLIWAAIHRLSAVSQLQRADVEQILSFFPEFLENQEPLDVRLLKIKSARSLILNSVSS